MVALSAIEQALITPSRSPYSCLSSSLIADIAASVSFNPPVSILNGVPIGLALRGATFRCSLRKSSALLIF
jgi:hypothetical protein